MEISKWIDINNLKIELQKEELNKLKNPNLEFQIAKDLLFKIVKSSIRFNNWLHILEIKDEKILKSLTAKITSLTIMDWYENWIIEFYLNKEDFYNSIRISVNLKWKISINWADIEKEENLDILNMISNEIEKYNKFIDKKYNKQTNHLYIRHNKESTDEQKRAKRNISELRALLNN